MKKEMLINVLQPEECRIAIVEDGTLEELYVERASQESYVGNIYKGKIVNIEAGIQAAFVDFGIGRNGFLHVTDVDPVYYKHLLSQELRDELDDMERDDRPRGPRRDRGDGGDRGARGGFRRDAAPPPARYADADEPTQEFTSFLPPDPGPGTPVEEAFSEDISEELAEAGGFLEGLDDTPPAPPPIRRMPVQVTTVPPPPPPRRAPAPPPASARDDEDEDNGFMSGLDLVEPTQPAGRGMTPEPATEESEKPFFDPVADTEGDIPDEEPAEEQPAEASEGEAEPKKKKPRPAGTARKGPAKKDGKGKVDDKAKADDKGKAKPKKPKKKDDDEPKSRPMDSAERRTGPDDEPEIAPFFDDGGGFDIDAPNDRFAQQPAADAAADDESGYAGGFENDAAEAVSDGPGRPEGSFTDADLAELDAATERRFRESDEERDQRRGRGGGRGDRDRGPRGDRGGDRGDRRGPPRGDRGGDRGDRRGPPRGGPLQNKAHTRHKGLPIPPIQDIFKRGQEVIIQVIKEGIGTKGPTLSTFVSIAGRYLVLMPSLNRVGVSKKIEDRDTRHRLRDIMNGLNPPKGVGFIVRTAAVDRDETELRNDLVYLLRLWQVVVKRIKRPGPVEVYRESDMITRTIRDIFTADIDTIWVDEEKAFAHASEFLQIVMPKYAGRIRYHGETEPLFHRYRVDDEIAKINQKRLDLPGGGSIIIEQTEALVAIDVNSGNFRAEGNAEETAFQMNLRAAKEIARQLRLRDLGGVIVNDFIDMRAEHHRRQVEDALRNALRRDRARTKTLRISEFGIIEMTRQRMQPSLKKRVYNDCPHCTGTGYVKTNETMGIEVMRLLQLAAHRAPGGSVVTVTVHSDVAFHLLNRKRRDIAALEAKVGLEVMVDGKGGVSPDLCEFRCLDSNGMEVRLLGSPPPRAGRFGPPPPRNGGNGGRRED